MQHEQQQNATIIDRLVVAYNAQDARGFADLFAADALHGTLYGSTQERGREAIFQRYVETFARYPGNRTEVLHRTIIGSFVVDHERVRRSPDAEPFEVVAIYTLADGLITRLDLVR